MCWWGRVAEAQGGSIGERGDGGGTWVLARTGMTVAGGPLRVPSGQASTGSGRTDSRCAPAVGVPHPAPLWIPAFAGMTMEGGRPFDGLRVSGPHCPAPLDTGFCRYDGGGRGANPKSSPLGAARRLQTLP